jgi:hypothetical protein
MPRAGPRLHPCLPVPAAERRRLATAAHLALAAMLADEAQAAWVDLPAAVAVAAAVLDKLTAHEDARQAIDRAADALVATAGLSTPSDEAKAACSAFLPYYEAILATVTWRRLIEAQRLTDAAWRAHAGQ